MSSATRLLGLSIALASALVSHSFAKGNSLTVGPLLFHASAFSALTYVDYDTNTRSAMPEWDLPRFSAVSSFNARATLRVSRRAEIVAEVRGRSRNGFPRHSHAGYDEYSWWDDRYDPPEDDRLDTGDLYAVVRTPGERYRVTAGRFVVPLGSVEELSDNAAISSAPFAINPLLLDGVAGSSVDLPRELGARFDVLQGRSMLTLAVTQGVRPAKRDDDIYAYRESMTAVARARVSADGPGTAGFSVTTFQTADTEPREHENYGRGEDRFLLRGLVADVVVVRPSGAVVSGGIAGLLYDDDDPDTRDGVVTLNVATSVPIGALVVSGAFSTWLPTDDGGDGIGVSSHMPIVGYSIYRAGSVGSPGLSTDQRIFRFQFGADVPLAEAISVHGEFVADRLQDGIEGFESRPITTVGAMVGLRAAI